MTDKPEYLVIDGDALIREVNERMAGHYARIALARQRNAEERHILEQEAQRFAEYAPKMQQQGMAQAQARAATGIDLRDQRAGAIKPV